MQGLQLVVPHLHELALSHDMDQGIGRVCNVHWLTRLCKVLLYAVNELIDHLHILVVLDEKSMRMVVQAERVTYVEFKLVCHQITQRVIEGLNLTGYLHFTGFVRSKCWTCRVILDAFVVSSCIHSCKISSPALLSDR